MSSPKSRRKGKKSNNIQPASLRGLKQAAYILKCLEQKETKQQIVLKFGGDEQLVEMWILFLLHNHHLKKESSNGYIITDKGKSILHAKLANSEA